MNVKSFSFGLGMGMIWVGLIFYLTYSLSDQRELLSTVAAPPEITDEEIIDRATKLGMIHFSELPSSTEPPVPQDAVELLSGSDTSEEAEEMEEDEEEKFLEVTIPRGSAATHVAILLEEKGIVDDADQFLAFIREKGLTKRLKFGSFLLPVQGDYEEILTQLKR